MTSLHQINGGFLGTRLEAPSSEPSYDLFCSLQGTFQPTYPNWSYGEPSWYASSRDSDGYHYVHGVHSKIIFSEPLSDTGSWTIEFYGKSGHAQSSAPQWVCLWTALDQRHRPLQVAQFHYYGDPGLYDSTQHHRSNVTTHDQSWHHYMWSCSSGTVTFYVDGTARISNVAASTWGESIYGMIFGNWYHEPSNNYPADHYVKNLRVTYGQALTAASPLPSYGGGDAPSGVYKLGSKTSIHHVVTQPNSGPGGTPTYKVGRLDATSPTPWFANGYVGIDKSAYFEPGKTYTTFKILAPDSNARTLYPCIMGRDLAAVYAVGGFQCNIPAGTSGREVTFDLTDPNLPGKFGSFTVPFAAPYVMGWHAGTSGEALLAEYNAGQQNACIDYVQTSTIPTLSNSFVLTNSNQAVAMQMQWS